MKDNNKSNVDESNVYTHILIRKKMKTNIFQSDPSSCSRSVSVTQFETIYRPWEL